MRRRTRVLAAALTLLLCLGFLSACGKGDSSPAGGGTASGSGQAEATVMVYIVGSGLETEYGSASADILEMVNSGYDFGSKNLLIMTGGAGSWDRSLGIQADRLGIYQLNRRGLNLREKLPLASMGDAGTLTGFLNYCVENYPAESYGLILWDHGGGPLAGWGEDELFGDRMSLRELVSALEDSPFGEENKLSFLGFDAGFMSSAELARAVCPYARYMIASEELVPAQGWDYRFLAELGAGPLDGWQAGQVIVDSYAAFYSAGLSGESLLSRLTLSCLDLSRAETLEAALNELADSLRADLAAGRYLPIARARHAALPLGRYTADSDFDLIDLGDLAQELMEDYPEEAAALRRAVDDMVVYDWAQPNRAHGLSLYFPFDNKEQYAALWGGLYAELGFAPDYADFLSRFGQELLYGGAACWLQGLALPEQDQETGLYSIQLTEEQAEDCLEGSFYLLRRLEDGHYRLCGRRVDLQLDEDRRLSAHCGGYGVYVFNNLGELYPVLFYDYAETGSHDYHVAAALHTDPMGDGAFRLKNLWFLVSLPDPGDSASLGTGIPRRADLSQPAYGKEELSLLDYPCVYFPLFETWEARDGEGKLLPVSAWRLQASNMFAAYDTGRGWRAELRPLWDDGGEYWIQFVVRDSHGQEHGSELIPVELSREEQQSQSEMFQDRYYPLPPRSDAPPALPPLESLRYFTDNLWYRPAELERGLVLDDPSGLRMTLLAGVYRLDTQGGDKDLVLVFRVDNNSRYFDTFDLKTDGNLRIQVGDRLVRAYFLPEITGVWQQKGGSYYYTLSLPVNELPAEALSLSCVFRLSQKEMASQLNLYYETEPVVIPLPVREQPAQAVQIENEE